MRQVKRAYSNQPGLRIDNDTYYIFIIPGETKDASKTAFMPRKRQSGFVYTANLPNNSTTEYWATVIAHELGHGAFRLEHHAGASSTTDNLMDYNMGRFLHQYQWNFIHNPVPMIALFQDDEEGAYGGVSENRALELAMVFNHINCAIRVNQPKSAVYYGSPTYSVKIKDIIQFQNFDNTPYAIWDEVEKNTVQVSVRNGAFSESAFAGLKKLVINPKSISYPNSQGNIYIPSDGGNVTISFPSYNSQKLRKASFDWVANAIGIGELDMSFSSDKIQNFNWTLEKAVLLSECDLELISWDTRKKLLKEFSEKSGLFGTSAYDIYEYTFIKLLTTTPERDHKALFSY